MTTLPPRRYLWMDMFSCLTRVAEVFLFRKWLLCGMIRDWKGVCGQQMGHGGASCQGIGHCQRWVDVQSGHGFSGCLSARHCRDSTDTGTVSHLEQTHTRAGRGQRQDETLRAAREILAGELAVKVILSFFRKKTEAGWEHRGWRRGCNHDWWADDMPYGDGWLFPLRGSQPFVFCFCQLLVETQKPTDTSITAYLPLSHRTS